MDFHFHEYLVRSLQVLDTTGLSPTLYGVSFPGPLPIRHLSLNSPRMPAHISNPQGGSVALWKALSMHSPLLTLAAPPAPASPWAEATVSQDPA